MKKLIVFLMIAVMLVSCVACGTKNEKRKTEPEKQVVVEAVDEADEIKIGLICLHDENSTYDLNFIEAFKNACEESGVTPVIYTGVPEGQECYETACELADDGCELVFADSFGHEDFMIQAASEYPDVQFCHATGVKAHTEGLDNYHNAFASIYEGRYLDGVAAGLKVKELVGDEEAYIGYVGAYNYAEVVSGYTAFYLGAKSVCPNVKMKVTFTGSWYDETLEKEAANLLIDSGCVLISGHADSMGFPNACQNAGVPFVFYNGDVSTACPDTFIVATKINWQPYFEYVIDCIKNGESIATDWTGTLANGAVEMTAVNETAASPDTTTVLAEVETELKNGDLSVFDTSTFTVNGETLTTYLADVDFDTEYTGDTEAIVNGAFSESIARSAPYFNIAIDGIEII